MISKNDAKYIQSLYHKKTRDEEGLFVAEGPKLVNELLKSDFEIKHIYALNEWMPDNNAISGLTIIEETELQKISNLQTPNQVLAIVKMPGINQEPVLNKTLTLVLDGIQDPGNMGTILRIADWFGIYQVIASEDTVDIYSPKVVQATMGSIARVKVWYKSLSQLLAGVPVKIYGAMLNGDDVYKTGQIKEGLLVIGNEGGGIRKEVLPFVKYPLTIPKRGGAESLNAAVATGIILSHITGGGH